MSKEIALFNQPIQDPKIIIDKDNLEAILTEIRDVKNNVFDLSTMKGVEDLKGLKSVATKWIKDFKGKCEPYEAEGKKISDARSKISTTLLTGKESVINEMLEPIITIERKLKDLNISIVTPINDLHSCDMRAEELEELENYCWLAYDKQAKTLIEQQKALVAYARDKIESEIAAEKKRLDVERLNREAEIAKNAAEQAAKTTEQRLKKEEFDKKRVEEEREAVEEMKKQDKEHRRKINNQIFDAIGKLPHDSEDEFIKSIIKAVANNKIPHLYIKY